MATKRTAILVVTAAALILLLAASSAGASPPAQGPGEQGKATLAVPALISYQGRLTDPVTGEPKPDGTYEMSFAIYNAASGGSQLWSESYTGADEVQVTNGLFNVLLGSQTPLSATIFDGAPRWLQVEVEGEVLLDRQQIVSVAYAFQAQNADTLDGAHASSLEESAEIDSEIAVHAGDPSAHHTKTTDASQIVSGVFADARIPSAIARDSEIMPTVLANDGSGSGLDADTLDGSHASAFAPTAHTHDDRYVNEDGDLMRGDLDHVPVLDVANAGSGYGVSGYSESNIGVYGGSGAGSGLVGISGLIGVYGNGEETGVVGAGQTYGVKGSGATGVWGDSTLGAGGTGVWGRSSAGTGVLGEGGLQGVRGDGGNYGVYGYSENGVGLYGSSVNGPAIYATGNEGVRATGVVTGVTGIGGLFETGVYGEAPSGVGVKGKGDAGVIGEGQVGVRGDGLTGVHGEGTQKGVYGVGTDYSAIGVEGRAGFGTGVKGFGETGVFGESSVGVGVEGRGATGVSGRSTAGYGVRGESANGHGVYGTTNATAGHGVHGEVAGSAATGVYGESSGNNGVGVAGYGTGGSGTGVYGNGTDTGVFGSSDLGTGVKGSGVTGVWGVSTVGTGVRGEGGAYGVYGSSDSGMGIFGSATDPASTAPAVYGRHEGAGPGVQGESQEGHGVYGKAKATGAGVHGVYGETSGDWGWASGVYGKASQDHAIGVTGWNTAGGAGVYGYSVSGVGVVAFSESGNIIEAWDASPYSRRFYVSNEGHVYADGDVQVQGDLNVAGSLNAPAPTCAQYDVFVAGESTVEVPSFCVNRICMIVMWNDATMGAFDPGFSWPAFYMQNSADNSWIGGPSVSIGGFSFSGGAGVNGDASGDGVFLGGMTVAGGYVSLYDDGIAENSPDLWTIEFVPDPPRLTRASYYICPWFSPATP